MIKRILCTMTLFTLVGLGSVFAQDSSTKSADTVRVERDSEKQAMIDDIIALKYRLAAKKYRQKKFKDYLDGVNESIDALNFKKIEMDKLNEQLVPYLEDIVDQMEAFIKNDLPFSPVERRNRIDDLRGALGKDSYSLSEKLRRIFALGLQIEAQYGKVIEPDEGISINVNGNKIEVSTFRYGRLGMYYLSDDEKQIGKWNRASDKWEALPGDQLKEFKKIFDMVLKKRSPEVVELPLDKM